MSTEPVDKQQQLISNYTYAGLLPFFICAFGPWVFADYTMEFTRLFVFYAFIILAFLAGTVWGTALSADINHRSRHLHSAILFSLLPLIAYFLPLFFSIGLTLAGFLLLLLWEKNFLNSIYPHWYHTLRHKISFIVIACHMLMILTLIRY